ncbi:MAG: ATP-binding protein [Paenibacillus sp.]|nr:ATP-binding protein [Paenibacillus sp.]
MIDFLKINSGETIGLSVLKVASIPHMATLTDDMSKESQNGIIENAARGIAGLLNEIYQLYKEGYTTHSVQPDLALEIIWVTHPVENQPFKAAIDIYIILRAINNSQSVVEGWISDMVSLLSSTFENEKYELKECPFDDYFRELDTCRSETVQTIVREERLEDLQNQYLPAAYAFDLIPTDYQDLSKLTNILIANPNCAVSFQIIPTYYSNEELADLNKINQLLSMLSSGIQERNVGTMSISTAEKVSTLYKYYTQNESKSLFSFNIAVFGGNNSLPSRVIGQLSASRHSTPNFKIHTLPAQQVFSGKNSLFSCPWIINEALTTGSHNMSVWQSGLVPQALYRLPYIITSDEAANFFRLPIGSDKVNAGLVVDETGKSSKTYSGNLINSGDIIIGKLKTAKDATIGLSLKDLAKHMLITGTPGSGKTTFSVGLLDRLWKNHHIPFLVIEPAKNEYRSLIQSIPDIQIFTPGKNFISPFLYNPFVPPKNVKLETYKSTLKTAFAAGVTMTSPLDKIFEETVNNCYSDFRWLDTYTIADKGKVFNITDFIKCFQDTFDEIGYTGDARNIGRAGVVRLKSLTNLFDNYFSIPIEDILSKPTIIELAAIENTDQKALLIALVLLSILAYVNANYVGEGGLRNFILLEEAHVLLDADGSKSEGAANPTAIAQGLVKRMLAEIRSYGVGLAIADQSPRKVGIDIVALTDIKVAFRSVESQDKQILSDATGMTFGQMERLSKLKPGETFLFFNRLDTPEEVVTPDYRLDNNIAISLSDNSIKELSTYWRQRPDKLKPYPQCAVIPYCKETCCYDRRILAKEVARRIFNRYIKAGCKDIEKLKYVLSKIQTLIKEELNDETFSRELLSCVKVYLWRKIKYETLLNISESTVNNSLSKL